MGIVQFLGLSKEERFFHFWDNCTFLEHYRDIDCRYHLYRLHDFYVELTSDSEVGLYDTLAAFKNGPRLDKYRQGDINYIDRVLRGKNGDRPK